MIKKKKKSEKQTIGWVEHIDFSDWNIKRVKAKVDTGAKTSSLDVHHIERIRGNKVHFNVLLSTKPSFKKVSLTAKLSRISKVKASPSQHESRVFVMTKIKIGQVEKEIEVNLIDRSNMVYRMLLGRSAIKKEFLVDVSRKYLLDKKKKKLKKIKRS